MKKIIIPLLFIFSINSFCTEQQFSPERYAALAQKDTPIIISYFNKLIEKNIIGIEHLKKLEKAEQLINPITAEERVSFSVLPWATQLDGWLKYPVDMQQINTWATQKLAELQQAQDIQKQVHEDTKEIHRPMRFVPIPAGKYVDEITHEEFEISEGVEMQETPVTQWQWVKIMENNPSQYIDGPDTEEVIINNKKIKMRPDAPVENISNNGLQTFIFRLNQMHIDHSFNVPTVREYQAVLQAALGSTWLSDVHVRGATTSGTYLELNGKRIFDLVGTMWQWSLDQVALPDKETAEMVFGGPGPVNSLKDLVRPVVLINNEISQSFGLRLIRYSPSAKTAAKKFYSNKLSWDWWDSVRDPNWIWDDATKTLVHHDDIFYWMEEHKNSYSRDKQEVIKKMFDNSGSSYDCDGYNGMGRCKAHATRYHNHGKALRDVSLIPYMQHLQALAISHNNVYDISPLAQLQHLERLDLDSNFISNADALGTMKTVKRLNLENNWIKDINFVAQLTNLEALMLSENRITSPAALAGLIKLTQLSLTWNNIDDVNALASLTNLTDLRLKSNNIKDILPLSRLHYLETLSLAFNPIKDLTPLTTLKNLKTLYLDKDQIAALHPQEVLPWVQIEVAYHQRDSEEHIRGKTFTYLTDGHLLTDITTKLHALGLAAWHNGIPVIGAMYIVSKTLSGLIGCMCGLCRRRI